jgi:glycine dehydrogenase subunit 2
MRNTRDTKLLFELSDAGCRAHRLPKCDVPERSVTELLPKSALAERPPALPELSEPQVVRHFANLSQLNMSVDTHFYPLGSCTMKYNPKRNERVARMPGFSDLHPYQPEETCRDAAVVRVAAIPQEISGLDVCSLQPAAAHGELTASWPPPPASGIWKSEPKSSSPIAPTAQSGRLPWPVRNRHREDAHLRIGRHGRPCRQARRLIACS